MLLNVSSSCHSPLPPLFTSLSSDIIFYQQVQCLCLRAGAPNMVAIMAVYVLLLLPVNVLVLYLSHRRWRRPSSATTMTHSDVFTNHMSIMELINIFGVVLIPSGVYTDMTELVMVGLILSAMNLTGVMLFHTLTCVERHLAVVHPITYLGLKKAKGIRMRNAIIGVIWLMSVGGCPSIFLPVRDFAIISLSVLGLVLIVIYFCSLTVLCVLVRPGPADRSGRQQTKLKAFHTITAIMCVLLLKFGGFILIFGVNITKDVDIAEKCYLWLSLFWFCLPSNLVPPLLFLLREGKRHCCQTRQQSD